MADDIQIEQFRIAETEALLSFLQNAYPSEPKRSNPDFWTWHFLENPYTDPGDLPVWVAVSGGQIVGHLAGILVKLKAGSAETRAIWIVDFIIRADFRGKGLGKRLALAAQESNPTMLTLGVNAASEGVFRSLNWTLVGGIHRYHKLLFPGNAYGEIAKYELARKSVNRLFTPFRNDFRLSQNETDCVRQLTSFDTSFADLWRRASQQWNCAIVRDPAYLEWQYQKQPGKRFDILGAFDKDRLVGYAVMFFRKPAHGSFPPKATISDMVYSSEGTLDVVSILLKASIGLAVDREAGSLVTDVLDERVEKRARELGFFKVKTAPRFMANTTENIELICDKRNWFLTRGDSDTSIFEEPNL